MFLLARSIGHAPAKYQTQLEMVISLASVELGCDGAVSALWRSKRRASAHPELVINSLIT